MRGHVRQQEAINRPRARRKTSQSYFIRWPALCCVQSASPPRVALSRRDADAAPDYPALVFRCATLSARIEKRMFSLSSRFRNRLYSLRGVARLHV